MAAAVRRARPTLLFTDIEGSTKMWEEHREASMDVLDRHDAILTEAIQTAGGDVVKHTGDGVVAVFPGATAAIIAAVAAQQAFAANDWRPLDGLEVRMGIHTGDTLERDDELHGWALNMASRVHAMAHGGQIIVSADSLANIGPELPANVRLLDLGPHRVRDIAQPLDLLQVCHPDLPSDFPPLRGQPARREISGALGRIVGRQHELELLDGLLRENRLVSLIGPPGVGKTRLAVEVGATRSTRFTDGVVFCELAGVAPHEIGNAVAAALRVQRRTLQSAEASVVEWLRDRALLIILDNCEDAVDMLGQLSVDIVRSAQGCSVLATSRQALDVGGERVVRIQPLQLPEADDPAGVAVTESPAVELFLQRATEAGVELAADETTLAVVAQVCRAVAGVPLAIELAAANTPIMALDELLVAVGSGDRTGSGRSAPHHRTVDDALQWSYDRQAPELQDAFRRSSVFAGSFDREAFAAVCALDRTADEAIEILRSLVDRSLLVADTSSGRARFRLLEPVRSFADAQLHANERAELRASFTAHIVVWAEQVARELRGPEELHRAPLVAMEFDNLRAVFSWSIATSDAETSLRLVSALWDYAFMRMRTEIFDWAERAAVLAEAADFPGRSDALGIASLGAWVRENPDKSAALAAEAFRLERDEGIQRTLAVRLATQNSARYSDAGREAPDVFREIVELSEALGDPYWLVNVDVLRSIGQSLFGRSDRAHSAAVAALHRAREVGNPSSIAWALFALGLAIEPSDPEHAEEVLDDALTHARSVDNRWVAAMCMARLVSVRRRLRGALEAVPMLLELLDLWERAGHRSQLWSSLDQAALCLAELGDDAAAITVHQAAATARLAMPPLPGDARAMGDSLARIRAQHGDDAVTTWSRRAAALDLAATVALASRRLGRRLELQAESATERPRALVGDG